jgi:hypothetical protein
MRNKLATSLFALMVGTGLFAQKADASILCNDYVKINCPPPAPVVVVNCAKECPPKKSAQKPKSPKHTGNYIYDDQYILIDTAGNSASDYCGPNDYKSFAAPEPANIHKQRNQYLTIDVARDRLLTARQQEELDSALADYKITSPEAKRLNDMGVKKFKFLEKLHDSSGRVLASTKSDSVGINYRDDCGVVPTAGIVAIQNNTYVNVLPQAPAPVTTKKDVPKPAPTTNDTPIDIRNNPEKFFPTEFNVGIGPIEQSVENTFVDPKTKKESVIEDSFSGYQVRAQIKHETENKRLSLEGAFASLKNANSTYTPFNNFGAQTATAISHHGDFAAGHHAIRPTFSYFIESKKVSIKDAPTVNLENPNRLAAGAFLGLQHGPMNGSHFGAKVGYVVHDLGLNQPDAPSGDTRRVANMTEGWLQGEVYGRGNLMRGDAGNSANIYGRFDVGAPATLLTSNKDQQIDKSIMWQARVGVQYWMTPTPHGQGGFSLEGGIEGERTDTQKTKPLEVHGGKVIASYHIRF